MHRETELRRYVLLSHISYRHPRHPQSSGGVPAPPDTSYHWFHLLVLPQSVRGQFVEASGLMSPTRLEVNRSISWATSHPHLPGNPANSQSKADDWARQILVPPLLSCYGRSSSISQCGGYFRDPPAHLRSLYSSQLYSLVHKFALLKEGRLPSPTASPLRCRLRMKNGHQT